MCGCCHMGSIYCSPCMCKVLCIWKRCLLVFSLERSCLSRCSWTALSVQPWRGSMVKYGWYTRVWVESPLKYSHYFLRNSRWTQEVWTGLSVVLNIAPARPVHASLCCKLKSTGDSSMCTANIQQSNPHYVKLGTNSDFLWVERVATELHDSVDTLCHCFSLFWKPVLLCSKAINNRHAMTHARVVSKLTKKYKLTVTAQKEQTMRWDKSIRSQ